MDFTHWGGANRGAPIFVTLCAEDAMESELGMNSMYEHAPQFKALIVFIEHRYYGKSVPFGSAEEGFRNTSTLGYFNSAQALADYAELILHIKQNLSAESSPVIVFGGSYGGMLAAWFRLKYPHVALGALASSAPILDFQDISPRSGYLTIVSKDFRDVSESCHDTIRQSWSLIDELASKPNGLLLLSKKFNACEPLTDTNSLKSYLEDMYSDVAQYEWLPDPRHSVKGICDAIDSESTQSTDVLDRVYAGVVAHMGQKKCYHINPPTDSTQSQSQKYDGWGWQCCTELLFPMGPEINATMFELEPGYTIEDDVENCREQFGVTPRPHWTVTEYGGLNIKLVLEKFASNIIFSNGLRDPFSYGGVLENISDSVVSLTTAKGSHCLDLGHSTSKDPSWLTQQRKAEFKIIKGWIADYNKRMLELKLTTASSASAVQISLSSLARLSVMALICFILARLIV
ncbi:hypothetical protein Syun_000634 [Stephania yunnanensis]|uniref:Lysosomal Pro-X carboxypeptidase n=1 Tax=Stephania yunnanensis TaxID=152371 RepID=A0AAP0LGC1_9MAGN